MGRKVSLKFFYEKSLAFAEKNGQLFQSIYIHYIESHIASQNIWPWRRHLYMSNIAWNRKGYTRNRCGFRVHWRNMEEVQHQTQSKEKMTSNQHKAGDEARLTKCWSDCSYKDVTGHQSTWEGENRFWFNTKQDKINGEIIEKLAG